MEQVHSRLQDLGPQDRGAPSFIPIPLESLRLDTVTDFKIYVLTKKENKPVLYRAENLPFTQDAKKRLQENQVVHVYIDGSDQDKYKEYVEQNLDQIVRDDSIETKEKAEIVYSSATFVMQKLFDNPRAGKNIRRCEKLAVNTVEFVLRDDKAFENFLAVTSYDYYTYTHCVNVCIFSVALAQKADLGETSDLLVLGTGALLHDVGKSLIDKSIVNKKGPLNGEEWAKMKEHPVQGVKILRQTGGLPEECYAVVGQHHERCDGSGYPRGLRGDEIHPYGRVSAIADVFDAMTTKRIYRDAVGTFTALHTMKTEMRDGLDQDMFQEFVQLLGR